MLPPIINSLAPIFLVIGLGWILRCKGFLSREAIEALARLAYWVGIPGLLFCKVVRSNLVPAQVSDLFLVTVGSTVAGMILSYLLALSLEVPKAAMGTFVQAAFRGNLAFVGLPVIFYAFSGSEQSAAASAEAAALWVFGPMVALYNVAAVLVLLISRHGVNTRALRSLFGELITNPLLLACLAGILYSASGWPLPAWLGRSLEVVGQMALPLALLCIGGSLRRIDPGDGWRWLVAAAAAKVILMPLLGYAIAWLVGLNADSTRIALILLACPTAAASYVLVHQLGGDETLASGAIVLSTPLAALSLACVLVVA